jgi:hypothetical protein
LSLAEGDRVRLFRRINATFAETGRSGNIGQNGTVLEVAHIQEGGLILRTKAGREGFVPWERFHDENGRVQLAYGDALTTHTAQGSTVAEHIHAMPSGSRLVTAFGAYTSGSRHREQSFIVTSEGAERAEIVGRRPLGDRREITAGDVLANVTRNFSRQNEKETAISLIERAHDVRRGTIRMVQASRQVMEEQVAAGKPASSLLERLENRRITRALESRVPAIIDQFRRNFELVGRIAQSMTTLGERVGQAVREKRGEWPSEREFWEKVAERASKEPEQTRAQIQTRGLGRRR